jgi:hypothetical protein
MINDPSEQCVVPNFPRPGRLSHAKRNAQSGLGSHEVI